MGYRIVRMAEELFTLVMTEGNRIPPRPGQRLRVVAGLPEGAKLEGVSADAYFVFGQVALKYSHPSWPDVPPATAIPELRVEYALEDDLPEVAGDLTPMEEMANRKAAAPPALTDTTRDLMWLVPGKGDKFVVMAVRIPAGQWVPGEMVRATVEGRAVLIPPAELVYYTPHDAPHVAREG